MKFRFLFALTMGLLLTACAAAPATQPTEASMETQSSPVVSESNQSFELTSTAFEPDGAIPQKYSCDGEDISPPLAWGDPPAGTQSLALIMDDPDAPGGTWDHWILFNIPPDL